MAKWLAWRAVPRPVRIGLWSLAAIVLLVVAGAAVFLATFDPDSLKPRIVAAVKQTTGRDLTLAGRIRLGVSLQPTLTVQDVSFANPPGFSRPQMATLQRLDLKLALIPLLSRQVEIDRLVLVKPDILLETNAQGQPNWQFTRESNTATVQSASANPQENKPTRISIAEVRIENGTLGWRNASSNRSTVLNLASFRATAASPDANVHIDSSASYNGTEFTLSGECGPLTRFQQPEDRTPWPVQLALAGAGAKLAVNGTVTQPQQGRGYSVKLTANVPDLAGLAPLLPGTALPPLHDVSFSGQVADRGTPLPEISSLALHVGASDLTPLVAGLKLDKLDLAVARLDQPIQVSAQGSLNNTPAQLTGSLGAPSALLQGAILARPVPIEAKLQAAGSTIAVKGTAGLGSAKRPSVQLEVTSDRIDADALTAAWTGSPAVPASPTAAAASAPPPPKPAANGRIIPDTPIPFDMLRRADADIKLSVGELKSGGANYRAVNTHLDLREGRLRLDPMAVDLPEGHLDAAVTADGTQAAPPVTLRLHAPSLAMQPLLVALHEPAYVSGNVEIQADLRGAGTTPHAIAASLNGFLGLTMTNGSVDNRLLGSTLGAILREVSLLDLVGRGGVSQVQCFAARFTLTNGVATVRPLALSSSLLTMDGEGSINLGTETLDLHVRPQARVAGTGVVVPLRVSGSLRSPSANPDPAAAVAANAGTVAGILSGATPLGLAAGALGGQKLLGGGSGVDCGAALAAARGQSGGAAPAPTTQPAPAQQQPAAPKAPNPGALLRQLFR
jgi:uncharacterized protein involved in outer membrane biogenesis